MSPSRGGHHAGHLLPGMHSLTFTQWSVGRTPGAGSGSGDRGKLAHPRGTCYLGGGKQAINKINEPIQSTRRPHEFLLSRPEQWGFGVAAGWRAQEATQLLAFG